MIHWGGGPENFSCTYMKYVVLLVHKKYYFQMQQYLNGPGYQNVNKVDGFQSGLSRMNIIYCFLFRCQKQSSN